MVSWPVNSPPTLLCSLKKEKHHEGEQLGNHIVQDDDDGDVVDVAEGRQLGNHFDQDDDDGDGDVVDVGEGLPEEGSPEQNHLGKKER